MTSGPQSAFDSGRTSWAEAGLWVGAGLLVLTMHAVAAGLLAGVHPPQQAAGARQEALFFEMAPLPEPSPQSAAAEAAETLPQPEPEGQAAEAPDVPESETPVEPPVEPAAPIEPLPPIPDQPEATMPAEAVEQVDEASDSIVELPPDSLIPLPSPRPVAKQATEKPAKREQRKMAVEEAAKKPPKAEPAKPAVKQATASANQPSKASKSRGAQSAPRVSPAKWQSKVLAWLNRHKRYPAAARARKASGSAHVGFSIDASGRVISARIARSSGDSDLDKAAVEMVRRSSPVPAPPPEIAKPRMSLTVPVVFDLK